MIVAAASVRAQGGADSALEKIARVRHLRLDVAGLDAVLAELGRLPASIQNTCPWLEQKVRFERQRFAFHRARGSPEDQLRYFAVLADMARSDTDDTVKQFSMIKEAFGLEYSDTKLRKGVREEEFWSQVIGYARDIGEQARSKLSDPLEGEFMDLRFKEMQAKICRVKLPDRDKAFALYEEIFRYDFLNKTDRAFRTRHGDWMREHYEIYTRAASFLVGRRSSDRAYLESMDIYPGAKTPYEKRQVYLRMIQERTQQHIEKHILPDVEASTERALEAPVTPEADEAPDPFSDETSTFPDREVHHVTGPPKLSVMMERWVADERKAIEEVEQETFETTLEMMADWDSYFKLILNADSLPSLPGSALLIIYSRRFAKLLEETRSGPSDRQITALMTCLASDTAKWTALAEDGQSLVAQVVLLHGHIEDQSDLIVPLTFRINATILLMGQRSIQAGLPLIVEAADTLDEDTNWAIVGYACDKILSTVDRTQVSPGQQAVLQQYATWKASVSNNSFSDYKVVELPTFRSTRRPHERATHMGAPIEFPEGSISVEFPPMFTYFKRRSSHQERYHDPKGQAPVAKRIVEFARRFLAASR